MDRLEESWPPPRQKRSPQVLEEVGGRLRQFDRKTHPPVGFGDTIAASKKKTGTGYTVSSGSSSLSSMAAIPDIHSGRNSSHRSAKPIVLLDSDATYTPLDDL